MRYYNNDFINGNCFQKRRRHACLEKTPECEYPIPPSSWLQYNSKCQIVPVKQPI